MYRGEPTAQASVITSAVLDQTRGIISSRLNALGLGSGSAVRVAGGRIVVDLPLAKVPTRVEQARAEGIVGTRGRLEFYDWEANALTPKGKTVASQQQLQDVTALTIGQGGTTPTGGGAGGVTLYDAVKLASKQPARASARNAGRGSQYYIFGAPGSAACAAVAKAQGVLPAPAIRCLLSGPDDNQRDLRSGLPAGVSASEGEQLVVRPGTVVVQAADANAGQQKRFTDPSALFYVLKDQVSLFGNDVTNPQQSTDQAGNPDVTFSFTSNGQKAFQNVTSQIAHRGDLASGLGQQLNQHFAVALDQKLITVPQIDFKTYPDGIRSSNGAEITGGLTIQSAQDLATQLRLGALPIALKLISASQIAGASP